MKYAKVPIRKIVRIWRVWIEFCGNGWMQCVCRRSFSWYLHRLLTAWSIFIYLTVRSFLSWRNDSVSQNERLYDVCWGYPWQLGKTKNKLLESTCWHRSEVVFFFYTFHSECHTSCEIIWNVIIFFQEGAILSYDIA